MPTERRRSITKNEDEKGHSVDISDVEEQANNVAIVARDTPGHSLKRQMKNRHIAMIRHKIPVSIILQY